MSKFKDGDMVVVRGQLREVHTARRDSDGDIKVWYADKSGWHFRREDECVAAPSVNTQVEPQTASAGANSNQETGINAMANTARSIVHVVLIDQDAGLDPSKAMVKDFGQHILQGSLEDLKMEMVMNNNMESILNAHNIVRSKEIDLDILGRTGNEVQLLPRKLGELTWKIGTVA